MSGDPELSRVFITHSSLDRALAERIVQALRLGTDVAANRIFCSSIEGYGVDVGRDFLQYIQKQLQGTQLVIPLISPAYLDSLFCQWELGAAWVREVDMFPIRVEPVTHDQLQGPLQHIQVAEPTRTGLNDLVERVAQSVGSTVHRAQWEQQRDLLLNDLPEILAKLRDRWRGTSAAKLRRSAQLADQSEHLHKVFHLLRDAAAPKLLGRSTDLDHFLEMLTLAADEIATVFSGMTGTPCRVTIKEVFDPGDESPMVRDLSRSGGTPVRQDPDPIEGNTDFEALFRGPLAYFLCNDIRKRRASGDYANTHLAERQELPYNSTVVWPIRKKLTRRPAGTKLTTSDWQDLIAYLCVDSAESDVFVQSDVWIGAAIADATYVVLRPWND